MKEFTNRVMIASIACIAFAGGAWITHDGLDERHAALNPAPQPAFHHEAIQKHPPPLAPGRISDQLDSDARDAAMCRQIQREMEDPSQTLTVTAGEPVGQRERLARVCASQPHWRDGDITSQLSTAAAAGSTDAQRALIIEKLHQDEQDVDAVTADGSSDQDAIREYYDPDIQALLALALHGDRTSAQVMASLWDDGRLLGRDPAKAAAWHILADDEAGKALPSDEIMRRHPAMDDFDDRNREAALSYVKAILAQMR